jgi:hypothetical protein
MPLLFPPRSFDYVGRGLHSLITKLNNTSDTDHIQRLLYLQKINYFLNTIALSVPLHDWLNNAGKEGWQAQLETYGINPDASFLLKGIQFAKAVSKYVEKTTDLNKAPELPQSYKDLNKTPKLPKSEVEYQLMQERDDLLKSKFLSETITQYAKISCQLSHLTETDVRLKEIVATQTRVLALAQVKLDAIKGKKTVDTEGSPAPSYRTESLGAFQANNANFTLQMSTEKYVFRVEDRHALDVEQDLHSFPVSKYFIEDFAVFMGAFKDIIEPVIFKPVMLSQFANQGDLTKVAENLKNEKAPLAKIAHSCKFYFSQLSDLCIKLIEAKFYHPDIKLSNFLVHDNLIRISDRKTLIRESNPVVFGLRITPPYAPQEVIKCLNKEWNGYEADLAESTNVDMKSMMTYELGMALKEFLIRTQVEEFPDMVDFMDHEQTAASYFTSPPNSIINISLLIQELTRSEPSHRLSLEQFNRLFRQCNVSPEEFYNRVEKELPSSRLGVDRKVDHLYKLLNDQLPGTEFIKETNLVINALSETSVKEPRLTRLAEKLATKVFTEYTAPFFQSSIDQALLNKDWNEAIWYRKAMHWLSFGYFRVEEVSTLEDVRDTVIKDLKSEEFQSYLTQIIFLPIEQLNSDKGRCFKDFVKANLEGIMFKDAVGKVDIEEKPKTIPSAVTLEATIPRKDPTLTIKTPPSTIPATVPVEYLAADKVPDNAVPVEEAPSDNIATLVRVTPTKKDDIAEEAPSDNIATLVRVIPAKKDDIAPVEPADAPIKPNDGTGTSTSPKPATKVDASKPSDSGEDTEETPKISKTPMRRFFSIRTALGRGDRKTPHRGAIAAALRAAEEETASPSP